MTLNSKTRQIEIQNPDGSKFLIGAGDCTVIAGPCSVESKEIFLETAQTVKSSGASILRGGLHKLRTSPDAFQGLGRDAYRLAQEVKEELGLPFITEITDPRQVEELSDLADLFQVGSRNMYNYALLSELGKTSKPILLKRAFSATVDEWIGAARYIEKEGNSQIILCERGIRTFDRTLRNTLDLGAVAYLKAETDYPVFVDPSHACGRRDLVIPLAKAAQAVGADGIMIEAHPNPDEALSDGPQSLTLSQLKDLMQAILLS
jgi:3-deoxy-7-phosphoheptulonate synthase